MHDLNTEFQRGQQLRREGRVAEALAVFDDLVRRFPAAAAPLELRGVTLCSLDRFDEGLADIRKALDMEPRNAGFHSDLGLMLFVLGRIEEARAALQRSLMLQPGHLDALINSCLLMKEDGDFEGAARAARQVLASRPDMPQGHQNLANAMLSLGRFAEAWESYCYRPAPEVNLRDVSIPAGVAHVDRLPVPPSPIIIHGEQGLGDTLFFLRFAPRLKASGYRLAFWGDARLHPLLVRSGVFEHLLQPAAAPAAGIPVAWAGDLPKFLGATDAAAFPPALPLPLDPARQAAFREQLGGLGPAPYVGLTWRAGIQVRRIALFKAIEVEALGRALAGMRGTFISLQRAPAPGETERLADALGAPVRDASAVNERLEDVHGLLALLDEYVGVSNTNTHLRASAGRAARVLIPWPPEWRWLRDAHRSPWFPEMDLYRQARDGDWGAALARLRADLGA